MRYELNFDTDNQVIIIRYFGQLDPSRLVEPAPELGKFVQSNPHWDRVVIDLCQAEFGLSTLEIYRFPELLMGRLANEGLALEQFKNAIIIPNIEEDFSFFENVMFNRGQTAQLFCSYDDALQWFK